MALIIAAASSKGGAGKTTLSAALACHYAAIGRSIVALDADPNRHLKHWLDPVAIPCHDTDDATIGHDVAAARAHADVVIIDLPGVLGMAITKASTLADALLIPTKMSDGDTRETVRTYRAAIDCRRPGGFTAAVLVDIDSRRSTLIQHTRDQLDSDGIPVFTAYLPSRAAYQSASVNGASLVTNRTVADDVAALAAELDALLAVPA